MDPLLDIAIDEAQAQTSEEGETTEQTSVPDEQQSYVEPQLQTVTVVPSTTHVVDRQYPSLYDSYGTTLVAIVLAVTIISSVIGIVTYIYHRAKSDHAALTQFVTTMFALIAGVFIADKIIAGPSTELLNEQEALKVLEFIQQTCLMVFAYYFGTKAQPPKEEPPNNE
jgi:hypothetical protein